MALQAFPVGKHAGAFKNHINVQFAPWQFGGVLMLQIAQFPPPIDKLLLSAATCSW